MIGCARSELGQREGREMGKKPGLRDQANFGLSQGAEEKGKRAEKGVLIAVWRTENFFRLCSPPVGRRKRKLPHLECSPSPPPCYKTQTSTIWAELRVSDVSCL